jgi:hypothetical protein
MLSRIVSGGAVAAITGATMLLLSSGPSAAFTLSSPSLEQPLASAGVEPAYWCRWGRCGWGWGYHPWARPYGYYRPYYYGYYGYAGPRLHCWIGPWGGRHCRWW